MELDQSQKSTLTEGNGPVMRINNQSTKSREELAYSPKKKNYFCILPRQSYQISVVDDTQSILVINRQYQTHKKRKQTKKGRFFPKIFCLLNKQGGN